MQFHQLAVWLFLVAAAAAQTAMPSNTTTFVPSMYNGVQLLLTSYAYPYPLNPLTSEAYSRLPHETDTVLGVNGSVVLDTPGRPNSATSLGAIDMAYLSCNTSDYAGFSLQTAITQAISSNVTAIVFYATGADYCNVTDFGPYDGFPYLYTMTSSKNSVTLATQLAQATAGYNAHLFSGIAYTNYVNAMHAASSFGGTGSTAIAMIILYAITGIITVLFLTVIVTGAIRAHRHPERYGPRNVLGIPQQSRAKGIARAMLETIPIVKFGEQRPDPKDVEGRAPQSSEQAHELTDQGTDGSTPQRNDDGPTSSHPVPRILTTNLVGANTDTSPTPIPDSAAPLTLNTVHSPSDPATAAQTPRTPLAGKHEDPEPQTCSICTDDFALGQDIRLLPCNHSFHPACVDPWLLDVSATCPLCRVNLNPVGSDADGQDLPPPLDPEAADGEGARRRDGVGRRHTLRSLFGNRNRLEGAGREERLEALRRWNEAEAANGGAANAASAPTASAAAVDGRADSELAAPEIYANQSRRSTRLGILSSMVTRRGRRGTTQGSHPTT